MKLQTFIATCPNCKTRHRLGVDIEYDAYPKSHLMAGTYMKLMSCNCGTESMVMRFVMVLDLQEKCIHSAEWYISTLGGLL